ncbi:SRPBCC family protein [Achromobacter ruhlandii]|uniref:SRPBCC family protein n=1 Tax=Achromobacter ruhlandii TaxID=72557 RepID=UPI0007BEC96A|nr:SRPBCC domain-containing protein [Achromobacter ruhlandii]
MTPTAPAPQDTALVLDYDLDAPPEKVWRAISVPALREQWLPDGALAAAEPLAATPGVEIRYRMRETLPPCLESVVTFQLSPNADGGTRLTIVHTPDDARLTQPLPRAANDSWSGFKLAA